jgi:hypothetical protein
VSQTNLRPGRRPRPRRETPADCVFCQRIKAEDYDFAWLGGVSFEPLNPVTPGHRLFVSRDHESPLDNPYAYHREAPEPRGVGGVLPLFDMWRKDQGITGDYNLILNAGPTATQTIEHLHLHYIPRRADDGLTLPWTGQQR